MRGKLPDLPIETELLLKFLVKWTNRALQQTKELYFDCGKDFSKLITIEELIKNNHLAYCPDGPDEIAKILKMGFLYGEDDKWFQLEEFKL